MSDRQDTRGSIPIDWLLQGEPWIVYRVRRDLLGEPEAAPAVEAARAAMLADPAVQRLVAGLATWPEGVMASHKSAAQPFHRLNFCADLGLTVDDPGVAAIAARIRAHRSPEGPFTLPLNPEKGRAAPEGEPWAWALCDAPVTVRALLRMGLQDAPDVRGALDYMAGLGRDNGWPCALSPHVRFRGPGRREDPCPYATLVMLDALAASSGTGDLPAAQAGAEALLSLWAESRTRHPYMFYMGTDFCKLKVPFVWYDLLHVLEVLTRFPALYGDPRLEEMLALLRVSAGAGGRYTPASVWMAWNDWEFGQKKVPSRWLTFLAWRILARVGGS